MHPSLKMQEAEVFLFPKDNPVNDMHHRAPGAHESTGIPPCMNPELTRTQDEASLLTTF